MNLCVKIALVAVAAFLCVACVQVSAFEVNEATFKYMVDNPGESLVLFYKSSEKDYKNQVQLIERVAKRMNGKLPSHFRFNKCDGDKSDNQQQFKDAGFSTGGYFFTSTPGAGIEKYTGPQEVDELVEHLNLKYMQFDERDTKEFADEDDFYEKLDTNGRPAFVKFYENWCAHCKALKPTFSRAATFFKGKIDFWDVECSKTDESKEFCTRNEVSSYPVLKLFTGDDKIKYEGDRSIGEMKKFFEKNLGEELKSAPRSASSDDGDSDDEDDEDDDAEKAPKSKTDKKASGSGLEDRVAGLERLVNKLDSRLTSLETFSNSLQAKLDKKKKKKQEKDL